MEKPDIIKGIKAALDRGFSIEKIINSYVKAGYNREDVIDSAKRVASDEGIELPVSIIRAKPTIKYRAPPRLIIKPRLPPQRRPIGIQPKIKTKIYFPEEAQQESLQIKKYAPPETTEILPIIEEKQELREEHRRIEKEPRDRKGITVVFILLIICASLLFVSLVFLLIFRTRVVEFLNSLSV